MTHDKTAEAYLEGSHRIVVDNGSQVFAIIVSDEDLEAVMPLCLKAQSSRDKLRVIVWAGRKSLSLCRYVQEAAAPVEEMGRLFVRHVNGDPMDFRRENLAWSVGSSGKIAPPKEDEDERERPFCVNWKRRRLLFARKEEAEAARDRLAKGEPPESIVQTGRKRMRFASTVAGANVAEWAIWLRMRPRELAEMREWMVGARLPEPWEDESMRRMAEEGWRGFGTEDCRLLALSVAEWMDRKAQAVEEVDEERRDDRRLLALLKGTTMRDPFEDFDEPFHWLYKNHAALEMPVSRTSFSPESEV